MAINLLIVDDSRTVRSVILKALRIAKVPTSQVFQAGNGKEALELVADNWVDLILADINMPIMNGVEMIQRLKANEATSAIPIVVVSTEGSTTRMAELEKLGVQGYVRKPFQPEDLTEVIHATLGEIDDE